MDATTIGTVVAVVLGALGGKELIVYLINVKSQRRKESAEAKLKEIEAEKAEAEVDALKAETENKIIIGLQNICEKLVSQVGELSLALRHVENELEEIKPKVCLKKDCLKREK